MSETQTNPPTENPHIKKEQENLTLIGVSTIAALSLMGLTGSAIGNAVNNTPGGPEEKTDKSTEYIIDATNAQYSSKDLIDDFTISEGGLSDPALDVIHSYLGEEKYDETMPLFYETLLESAKIQTKQSNPQPGDTFAVVKKDIDPEADNGKEYFVVTVPQVVEEEVSEIPTPNIESTSNQ